jgi:hypothetical protein
VEIMDKWLRGSQPGEIVRRQIHYQVKFGGHAEVSKDERGRYQVRWLPDTEVKGDAYDAAIREEVGAENLLLLGLTVEQARELKLRGYRPRESPKKTSLREILDFVGWTLLPAATATSSARSSTARCTKTHSWCRPITRLTWTARRGSVPYGATLACVDPQRNPQRGAYG